MKHLTEQLKQAMAALAFADLGERSGRAAMHAALYGKPATHTRADDAPCTRRMIALGVGDHLPPAVMAYVIGACRRMGADLLLITHDAMAVRYMLDPYLPDLAGIRCETAELKRHARSAVLGLLSRRTEVLFAVSATPEDPVASLLGGRRGLPAGKSPVPVVVVGPTPDAGRNASATPQLASAH
ncbi:MAG TPA: hypothetical protein PKH69_11445 [Thiobacillaceae bacterium]|nr:hypothetical protein [Thiobacillaceae bacterium]HNU65104.1 hypothetical protein [Thiobacillaceae bacterium]